MSDNELAAFIRARRESVTPADVGLPTGPRRRTPGLRRAELATLAGISVEYLTRLEQGRDRHPSPQILNALADALRLPNDERVYLRFAAKASSGYPFPCTGADSEPPAREVRPTVQALLDRLEPAPAVLLNRLTDVLAFTVGYERLTAPLGLLDARFPNLVRFVFTDPRAKIAYPDWDRIADARIAALRSGSFGADPHLAELTAELTATAGAPFSDRMKPAASSSRPTGFERLTHPEAGELRLAYETLELPSADDQRLIVYLPADTATSTALDRLTGRRPGALRMVNG
ncbi:Helix-turn-helix domain-containing protein [Streptosporangium subroseum]|uniref:Helix-turn-helix domain-containing protein n=1 Tax=Streptosporangium subroseum TaxID=106412 RepID=A0A239NN65_9ACTN|nr:helix-turn-helix transcriptional regulator [Streptosporangium subroseum]SNT55818.1 Helix-turn-helix domain-containing protein [Streptosporangium subroseum]